MPVRQEQNRHPITCYDHIIIVYNILHDGSGKNVARAGRERDFPVAWTYPFRRLRTVLFERGTASAVVGRRGRRGTRSDSDKDKEVGRADRRVRRV